MTRLTDGTIYLDHAGSGIVNPSIARRYPEYCARFAVNPHGGTRQAEQCRRAIIDAEQRVLKSLGIRSEEASILWTCSGTEALNLGIRGAVCMGECWCDSTAHPAMTESVVARASAEGANVRMLPVSPEGIVTIPSACSRGMVTVCHVNNETGVEQPLAEIRNAIGNHVLLVADCSQSLCKVPIGWSDAKIDLMAFSCRKIGGPAFVGGLIVRGGVDIKPLFVGGGQQRGLRSGTLDTVGILLCADAVEMEMAKLERNIEHVRRLRHRLVEGLNAITHPSCRIISPSGASPWIVCCSFPGYEGAVIKRILADKYNIVIGTGSACSAESGKTSHVLKAMKIDEKTSRGALRISFSGETDVSEVDEFLAALAGILRDY